MFNGQIGINSSVPKFVNTDYDNTSINVMRSLFPSSNIFYVFLHIFKSVNEALTLYKTFTWSGI
jgi:hypothetical protein